MNGFAAQDLDHAPCGFMIFDDTGIISNVNYTLCSMLGYGSAAELAGRNVEVLFTVAGRIFYHTHFFPLLKLNGKVNEAFFNIKMKEGGTLAMICNGVSREAGGAACYHFVMMPLTERNKYEQELLNAKRHAEEALAKNGELNAARKNLEVHSIALDRQVSRLHQINDDITQFSKVVSHDLQEPIRKIAMFADMAAAAASGAPARELEKIAGECTRLRQLAANLEKFISLNAPGGEYAPVALGDAAAAALLQVMAQPQYAGINTGFSIGGMPLIEGYEGQLQQLFYNIFDNCFKFSRPAEGKLHIAVDSAVIQQNSFRTTAGRYRYTDFAKITITDNGTGIDSRKQEQLFQMMKQTGNRSSGLGFGLAFCKKIVDNHYGTITAGQGRAGAVITVMLPLKQGE